MLSKHLIVIAVIAAFSCSANARNLINNSKVSASADGWKTTARKGAPEPVFDKTTGYDDNGSLCVIVNDKTGDAAWRQNIAEVLGGRVEYRFKYKTLAPKTKVHLLAEFFSPDWQTSRGQYTNHFSSKDTEWKDVFGSFEVPEDSRVVLSFWVNLNDAGIGTAWFDDFSLIKKPFSMVTLSVIDPLYKVLGPRQSRITCRADQVTTAPRDLLFCTIELLDGKTVVSRSVAKFTESQQFTLDIPSTLPDGTYELKARIVDNNEKPVQEISDVIIKRSKPMKVRFGKHDELIVDGKQLFPIVAYWAGIEYMESLKKQGFNCSHLGHMRKIPEHILESKRLNMPVIADIPEYSRHQVGRDRYIEQVKTLKAHPYLIAYYTADEAWLDYCPPSLLRDAYSIVKQMDPDRAVLYVDCQDKQFFYYKVGTDILGTDPYKSPQKIEEFLISIREKSPEGRPLWNVVRAFPIEGKLPTPEYVRCAVYTSLINGAKGILYFAFDFDHYIMKESELWEPIGKLNYEIQKMAPYLMNSYPKMLEVGNRDISAAVFETSKGSILLATNKNEKESCMSVISLPAKVKSMKALFGDNEKSIVNNGELPMTLKPYETRAYRLFQEKR